MLRTHTCGELTKKQVGEKTILTGWVDTRRDHGNLIFIDVRDPIEIMFTGFTDVVDINIPFKLANRTVWNDKKPVFKMEVNPNFEQEMRKRSKENVLFYTRKDRECTIQINEDEDSGKIITTVIDRKGNRG